MDDFRFKSVLNTDAYDRRTYQELRQASRRLQETERVGSEGLPTFPHLLGDVWAGLFKAAPELAPHVPRGVEANQALMAQVMQHPEFHALREYTRLDDLAAAIGAIQMGTKLQELITQNKKLADLIKQAAVKAEMAEQKQAEAEALQETAEFLTDEAQKNGALQRAQELLQEAQQALRQAERKDRQAARAMQAAFSTAGGQKALGHAIQQAGKEAMEECRKVEKFAGGLGYGHESGRPQRLPLEQRLALADLLRQNPKLRQIADLAGRMKLIAARKQRSKTKETVERTEVETGNDAGRLLPSELLLLRRPESRGDFLRRFAEGKLIQYGPGGRERLSKGPIVICIDTSGSMQHLDVQSKALMLALLAIARKQRRAFAVISFSAESKRWEFPDPRKVTPATLVEMAEFFWGAGTDFMRPLSEAMDVIQQSKFNRADVVFITDGEATVDNAWLKRFLATKRARQAQVIALRLGVDNYGTLPLFADMVIAAESLFDDRVTDAVFSI